MLTSTFTKTCHILCSSSHITFNMNTKISYVCTRAESRSKMKAISTLFVTSIVTSLATSFVNCDRIFNYKQVGLTFMQQYYSLFDNNLLRSGVKDFYDGNDSILIAGSEIYFGADKIMERLNIITAVVSRNVTTSDSQPTNDGGVIVNVYGRILYSDTASNWTTPHFTEMFILKPRVTSFFIQHQHLRTAIITNNINNNTDSLRFV